MSKDIKNILINRDSMNPEEADVIIIEARREAFRHVTKGEFDLAEQVCSEYLGLEPDYLDALLTDII